MSQQKVFGDSSPRRRIHKRTWAILFFCVIVPWILVAVPGEQGSWPVKTEGRISDYAHGWPFVHLDRFEVPAYAGAIPPEQPPLRLNLRLSREHVWRAANPASLGPNGFWTDPEYWPNWGPSLYCQIRPLGLICNLLILGLAVLLVGWIVEWRVCNGGFRFSLRSLLVMMALLSIGMGWCVGEYSLHRSQQQKLLRLQQVDVHVSDFYEGRFPHIVSQFLNHGHLPFLDSSFFLVLSGRCAVVGLYDDDLDTQQISDIAAEVVDSPLPIFLDIVPYTRNIENQLREFEGVDVESLSICFNFNLWVESFGDDENYTGNSLEDAKISGDRVNIVARFENLKHLHLNLDLILDQQSQIESFCGIKSLEVIQLTNLSQAGVEFMLKTKGQWPRKISVILHDDVNRESRAELEKSFDVTYGETDY